MRGFAEGLGGTLALPQPGDFGAEAVRQWYGNVARELEAGVHAGEERVRFEAYYREAGLLRGWRRPFFRRHYAEALAAALAFLFGASRTPTILDLGCGMGTQALLFALHGARVVAADADPLAVRVLRRRLEFYESFAGRRLPVSCLEGNAFELGYGRHAPFDGVYSLFAFNLMQPSAKLMDTLGPHLAAGARWAILDGNNLGLWTRLLPWRRRSVWSPRELASELRARGFQVVSQEGGVALPPPVWACLPYRLAHRLDVALCRSLSWPISCQTLALRCGGS